MRDCKKLFKVILFLQEIKGVIVVPQSDQTLSNQIFKQMLRSGYQAVLMETQQLQDKRNEELTAIKQKAIVGFECIVDELQKLQSKRYDALTTIKQKFQIGCENNVKDLQKLQQEQNDELTAIKVKAHLLSHYLMVQGRRDKEEISSPQSVTPVLIARPLA